MIPISRPSIGDEERSAVLAVLESGQLAHGPRVREFEERFAAHVGAKYAIALTSGTSALHVALMAHGIGPGDEVITPAFSFVASADCALFVGAIPVFGDIEPAYFNLEPAQLERLITERTRAIVPVHLFGQTCDMEAIAGIARAHGLALIQDACQSHGATFNGRRIGEFGTACYSFYATKNMTTGEGGMIVTNDPDVAERARMLREHGSRKRYSHEMLGYNLCMTDLQAALGLAQLPRLDDWNARRREHAAYLSKQLRRVAGVVTPATRPGGEHVFHQYTVRVQQRDEVLRRVIELGVGAGVYYPTPIPQQPSYQRLGYTDRFPQTERACREVMSLPVHPSLTIAELDRVVESVASAVERVELARA
jgi:perosamine synthetase